MEMADEAAKVADDISVPSSVLYTRHGADLTEHATMSHHHQQYREFDRGWLPLPLMTPGLFAKKALSKFLIEAQRNNDRYWWRLVPKKQADSATTKRSLSQYINATFGGKEFHHILMNQMTAKAGIKKHGEAAIAALIKEITHNLRKALQGFNSRAKEEGPTSSSIN